VIEEGTTLVAVHDGGWHSCSVGSRGKLGGTRGGELGGVGTNNNGSGHTRPVLATVRCSLDLGSGVGRDGGIGCLKLAGGIVHGLKALNCGLAGLHVDPQRATQVGVWRDGLRILKEKGILATGYVVARSQNVVVKSY
jgi:hypothetical protein